MENITISPQNRQISINIDEFLSINPSATVFVFGYFNAYHKDWLPFPCETYRPGELCL